MDAKKVLKIAGILLSVAGAGINFAADAVKEKELDLKIAEKVSQTLAKK